ncbi:MAG: radical SAM protein [Sedimentisphaerales bacterium]|nr:radical SAM protein [Sedimentisphaerales bacterium]
MINVTKLYFGVAGQSDQLRYGSENDTGPVVVYNCTARCNLNCAHCYSSSGLGGQGDELNTNQAKELLCQLSDYNCPVILLSGGEPLLREDLLELIAQARRLGIRVVLSTNGTLIDKDTANRLADAGTSYVGVSIDGQEQFHDEFRTSKGSFKAAVRAIENCRDVGIKTGLRFTITRANSEQIPDVFDIAKNIGVRRICFYHLIRTGRASKLSGLSLGASETRRAMDVIIEKTGELVGQDLVDEVLTVGNHCDGPYLLIKMASEKNKRYQQVRELLLANGGNRTGEKIACISWAGSVHPDQFLLNYSLGNIKVNSFRQIWDNPNEPVLQKLRNKTKFRAKRCSRCKWFDLCKGNYRFLALDARDKNWVNEPSCYLRDDEISLQQSSFAHLER